jgi:hypothetical protein
VPIKLHEGESKQSGKLSGSCATSGTRRVTLVTNPGINHERGKGDIMITANGTYAWTSDRRVFVCTMLVIHWELTVYHDNDIDLVTEMLLCQ